MSLFNQEQNLTDCKLLEGYFITPLERYLPGIVPEIARKAHFQVLLPVHWPEPSCKPVCLHLAGTGDHVSKNKLITTTLLVITSLPKLTVTLICY